MSTIGRLLQVVGLAIPLLAIAAQINESIRLGQMLMFLAVSVCAFCMGRIIEGYART